MNASAVPGKVALVIGAGDSTGSAIAARFAREGYIACLTRRSADKLQPAVDAIRAAGGQAFGYGSDARNAPLTSGSCSTARRSTMAVLALVVVAEPNRLAASRRLALS
mgnify:CR=1 FL=1